MKCKNCGNLIPDQSTFCPYCGVPLQEASYQPQPPAAISQPTIPDMPPVQQPAPSSSKPKKARGKVQKCPKCGALLSKKEKVCSICGEAMPKQPHRAKAAIISMSVVICLLLCSTVYFMLEMFQRNRTISELREEAAVYSKILEEKEKQISSLSIDVKIWKDDSKMWQAKYNDISSKYTDLVLKVYGH